MRRTTRWLPSGTARAGAAILAALVLAGCDDEPAATSDRPPAASTGQGTTGQGETSLIATNNPAGHPAAPDRLPSAPRLPPDDAAVIAELIATLADEKRLVGGTGWTSGIVGASGTILEADSVAGTECKRFRSSMTGADGTLLLVGVACERIGGWAVDELSAESA
jgi:hypothetical protein